MSTSESIQQRLNTVGLLALGGLILALHVGLLFMNREFFILFMCVFMIGYSIFVIMIAYKNQAGINANQFDLVVNMSFYTVFLELFLFVFIIILMIVSSLRHKY